MITDAFTFPVCCRKRGRSASSKPLRDVIGARKEVRYAGSIPLERATHRALVVESSPMTLTGSRIIALDIGGTSAKLASVTAAGEILDCARIPTIPPAAEFVDSLLRGMEALADRGDAAGIGISVAGFIDPEHAAMIYNPNIPWLEGFALRETVRERFHLPVALDADSNAGALGEFYFGAGVGAKRLLCLTVGTGIGGGFVTEGKLVRFTHECLGDVGHVIVAPGGIVCSCGGRGCAEAMAASGAILAEAGTGSLEEMSPTDPLFARAGYFLGLLCASLAAVFFPDRIVLGGGVCAASEWVVEAAREEFGRSASGWARRETRIVSAKLGAFAPLVGAACLLLKTMR